MSVSHFSTRCCCLTDCPRVYRWIITFDYVRQLSGAGRSGNGRLSSRPWGPGWGHLAASVRSRRRVDGSVCRRGPQLSRRPGQPRLAPPCGLWDPGQQGW